MKPSKSIQAMAALVLITMVWGASITMVKQSLLQVSPILFVAMRFWIAAAIAAAFMPRVLRKTGAHTIVQGFVLSAALLGGIILQTIGLRGTTPSRSAFFTSLSVLLVPAFGYCFFRYRSRMRTLAGVALATVGLGFLTLNALEPRFGTGDALTLISAAVFALYILLLGRYLESSDYRRLVILQLAFSAFLCTLAVPLLETPYLVWDKTFTIYLLITGVFATALAFYLQSRAQRRITPNRTALIFSLEPLTAVLFSWIWMGSAVSGKEWLGGVLILAGVVTSELRMK